MKTVPLEKNADGKYMVDVKIQIDVPTYDDVESQAYKRGDRPKYDD